MGKRKLESVNLKPVKKSCGKKLSGKTTYQTAVEIAKRGKTFYRDDNTAPYGIALLRL